MTRRLLSLNYHCRNEGAVALKVVHIQDLREAVHFSKRAEENLQERRFPFLDAT